MSSTHRANILGAWAAILAARGETITLARGSETADFSAVRSRAEREENRGQPPLATDAEAMKFSFLVATLQAENAELWPVEISDRITDTDGDLWEVQASGNGAAYRYKDNGRQVAEVRAILIQSAT